MSGRATAVWVLALFFGGLAPAHAGYLISDLGGGYSYALGQNSSQVVGYTNGPGTDVRAFVYDGAALHPLGTLGGSSSFAYDINSSGQVVGDSRTAANQIHAFVYTSSGGMHDLGTMGGGYSVARAVNDHGEIVGYSNLANGVMHAFLYTGGSLHDLGSLPGLANSMAFGVNAHGAVVGYAEKPGATLASRPSTAFLYSGSGPMQSLGTLGGANSYACGSNDAGLVVDTSTPAGASSHAFLYGGSGPLIDLDPLGAWSSTAAYDVNNYGLIAGAATDATGASHAVVFAGSKIVDLNGQLPTGSGWVLREARAINNHGQIVGYGEHTDPVTHRMSRHAFLLTPDGVTAVPEPASWLMMGIGSVVVAGFSWRRRRATA